MTWTATKRAVEPRSEEIINEHRLMTGELHNKVLIVDDDPAILRILSAHLTSGGYEVFATDNAEDGLQVVQREQPSYLITDWDMPQMDGMELCRRVRSLDLPHYLYVVVLSGRNGEEDLVTAIDAGADDFLPKPLRKHELLARLTAGARVLRLESRLSQLADNDALTGLLGRRPFNNAAEQEWRRAHDKRLPLSVVMLDIDYFKRINDTYGHPAGDEVIRTVAEDLRKNARKGYTLCRYGGEEFCVLLPETDEESAAAWAESLRGRIGSLRLQVGKETLNVTVSIGVADMLAEMEDVDELIALADRCLYAAKEQGRNRVISVRELSNSEESTGSHGAIEPRLSTVRAEDVMTPLVHCLRREWPIDRAASYFLRFRVNSAPVIDEAGYLLGIVSDKDVITVATEPDVERRCVGDVMRQNVITYDAAVPFPQIYRFLTRASTRCVVITSGGKPCGLISRSAVLRWFLDNHWKPAKEVQANCMLTAESVEASPLVRLGDQLLAETNQLRCYLQSGTAEEDTVPIIGGVTRIQQVVDELLASAASSNVTGGGIPY